MLAVRESFVWRGERYQAGVTRVAPEHPVTSSQHASKLGPAYERERGFDVLRFLERTRGKGRKRHSGGKGREPWRL
jgi:hypothetical protein